MKSDPFMTRCSAVFRQHKAVCGSLFFLLLQNLCTFWPHYTGAATFMKDFAVKNYPMTAFGLAFLQQHIFPGWISFQNMGFPYVLSMQASIFYPPLWIFAISEHLPYSMHAANIFQVMHVLFGAVGFFFYARLARLSIAASLFGAVAFQFFGGFYSNAEHPDMLRAFCYVPWLFLTTHVSPTDSRLRLRHLFLPVTVLFFITSVYQGNLVSQLFFVALFGIASWLGSAIKARANLWQVTMPYLQIAGLGLLGIGLASVYLLPVFELKIFLVRDAGFEGHRFNWPLSFWNSLLMPVNYEGIYIWPSMISAFVTVPVFCLLFMVTRDFIRQNVLWFGATVFAIAMAAGSSFFVFPVMVDVFPFLGYSRFPSSDYRGLFCFGLILLASGILDTHLKGLTSKIFPFRFAIITGLLLFYYAVSSVVSWLSQLPESTTAELVRQHSLLAGFIYPVLVLFSNTFIPVEPREWLVAFVLCVAVFTALDYLQLRHKLLLPVLVLLQIISATWFVKQTVDNWRAYENANQHYGSLDLSKSLPLAGKARTPLPTRPACQEIDVFLDSWRGYLQGDFICNSRDAQTIPREAVNASPVLDHYMRQPWQARTLEKLAITDCEPERVIRDGQIETAITQQSYGLQEIRYRVHSAEDFCFVENEMFFRGWSGFVAGQATAIEAQPYCSALRSWCLPKGDYAFTAHYQTPGLRSGAMLSGFFLLIYLLVFVGWFFARRNRSIV